MSTRAEAIAILTAVLDEKRTLDEAVSSLTITGDGADARFVMLLVLTVLRHLGQLDAVIEAYMEKPLPAKRAAVRNGLRIGAAQLLLLDTPPHAAVNETVQSIKKGKDAGLSGLVNAILQRIVREKPPLPAANHNLPNWLRARWENLYGVDAVAAIAAIASTRPPLDLYMPEPATLAVGERLDASIWRLPADHPPVHELEGFAEGAFWVQDIAASYPVRLLGDVNGKQVLDLAAAPGGKTAQLVKAGAVVTAVDRSPVRMATLKENMVRLKLDVTTVVADITEWHPDASYDAILLDAPCTATGTWRKHPEVVRLVEATDIFELMKLQRTMLTRAWSWLKPGGTLVYCVCSLEREEGESQVDWFLGTHKDASLAIPSASIPAAYMVGGMLRTLPSYLAEKGGMDGFFAVGFVKT